MNRRAYSASLLSGAMLLALAGPAPAVPFPRKPNNQAALLQLHSKRAAQQQLQQHAKTSAQQHLQQQHAKTSAQQHLLSQTAASRQHHLLNIHNQSSKHHLLKSRENFFKLHLIEEARRPLPPPPFYGYEFGDPALDRAPVTRIQRPH